MTTPQLYACLRYRDCDAAVRFLTAIGFRETFVVRDEQDPSVFHHAQFQWRDTGGIMFGSQRAGAKSELNDIRACTNLVVASDDEVDRVLAAGVDAGGTVLQAPHHPPHGGRTGLLRDPEGNFWNIDSYPGELG